MKKSDTPPRPATARVFCALWPEPALAAQLARLASAAADQFDGKPSRQESIHLTLAFLGNVPEARLPELVEQTRRVSIEAFNLVLDQLGFWPRQQLLWAGCRSTPAALLALVDDLHTAFGAAGFLPGKRSGAPLTAFVPHVTLVRKIPLASAPATSHPLPAMAALSWPCRRFVLARSRLSDHGACYELMAEFAG